MGPQNQNTTVVPPDDGNEPQLPPALAVAPEPMSPEALSSDPSDALKPDIVAAGSRAANFRRFLRVFLKWGALTVGAFVLVGGGVLLAWSSRREAARLTTINPSASFETQTVPLESLAADEAQQAITARQVNVNGQLRIGNSMVLTPSLQPSAPQPGQLYYDQNANLLGYFNGTEFIFLDTSDTGPGVEQIGGLTGQVSLGPGLGAAGGALINGGVLSLGGSTGAITLGSGLGVAGNVLQNTGVLNITAGNGISVTNNGNGTYTVANIGAGSGTVASSGGTAGRIPFFTDVQNIEDSLISQSGLTVTVSGDLNVVTGGLSLSNALTVSNGGTGTTSLAANGVLIGNGTGPITAVTAGGPNLCLLSTAGAPIFAACPSASGVTTLNGLNGALSVANASAAGSTITIDDASTSAKGIAQFNSDNFDDNGAGIINTAQDIHTGATPTFAGLNTNSITPSGALTIGAAGQTALLQGSTTTITSNGGGDIVLTSSDQIRLTGFNCSTFANGGVLTTDASGNLACDDDDGGAGGGVTSVNSLVGDLILQGTANQIVINDDGSDTLTLSLGTDVTLQGNTFNGANQLVQLNGSGQLPAVSGALLTNLNGSAIASGTVANARLVNGGELTVTAGTNLTGGGDVALGGSITLNVTDSPTFAGNIAVQGGAATIGTTSQAGSLVIHDGNGQTTTLQAGNSTGNLTFILPTSAGNVAQCLKQGGSNQLIWDDCEGGTGGISGVISLNGLDGALTIQGTANRVVVTDDGDDTITISVPQDIHTAASPTFAGLTLTGNIAVQGGTATIGTTSQAGSLVIHDGNGQTTTLQAGNSTGNLTFILPVDAGTGFQCLKKGTGNQLIWDDCEGGGGPGGVTSVNGLIADVTIQGTASQIAVNDNGTDTITLSLDAAVTLQGNTFNGADQLVQLNGDGELPVLSAVNLTDLNASELTTGTVPSSVISGTYAGITGVGTIATGTWQATAIAIGFGGTGATTQQGAINNLSGLTTQGDLLYHNGTNVVRLARGSNGDCLVSTTTTIQWGSCLGGGAITGSGTPGTIAVFTDTDELGDSLLSQDTDTNTVTVAGHLNLTSGSQFQIDGVQISSADLSNDSNLAKLNASQTFTGNSNAFRNGSDSANAFSVQNAAGIRVLTVDTTAGELELGVGSTLDGKLVFHNASDNNAVTILTDDLTDSRTILLPDSDGVICLDSGNCAGAGATLQTAYNFSLGGTTPKIKVNDTLLGVEIQDADTSINDYLLTVRASDNTGLGQVMFGVNSGGEVVIQSSTDSATALQLLTNGGTAVLTGDTQSGRIILGQGGTLNGQLVFQNDTTGNTITLQPTTATDNRIISIPDADGTICLTSGNCVGVGGTGDILQGGNSFGATMTIGTNDSNDLVLERNNATRLTVGANNITLASGIDLLLQGANAYISNPQTGTNTEAFGLNATVANGSQFALAVGTSASAATRSIAVGYAANAADSSTVLGSEAVAEAHGVAIGYQAVADSESIAIGEGAETTTSNQLVIGSTLYPINHAVIGNGVRVNSPAGFILQASSALNSNTAGASITIAGGQGTGSANGGNINFQISDPVADPSGDNSALNALVTVLSISGSNGAITAQNSTNSTTAFRILNASSVPLFNADTTNSRLYIGNPSADSTGALLVLDTKNTSGDPSGVDGSMYYNSSLGKFRCFQGGIWADCLGGGIYSDSMPTRVGTLQSFSPNTTAPATIDVSGVPNGNWMLLAVAFSTANASPSTPAGWTTIVNQVNYSATRKLVVMGKIKEPGDGVVSISKGTTVSYASVGLVHGAGGSHPSQWQVGSLWTRGGLTMNQFITVAPSVTTQIDNSLALALSFEATTAAEGSTPVTSGTGWAGNNWLYVADNGTGTNIDQIRIAYKEMPTAGATGDATDTYANSQVNNGAGVQVIITPSVGYFIGATDVADGKAGLVPAPLAGQHGSVLLGDGSWSDGVTFIDGAATFQNANDSTTAFRVLNDASTPLFVIDTTNSYVYIGNPSADSTGALLVLDTKNTSGDPTGIDGAMYYNSVTASMRCYEGGYWWDCNDNSRNGFRLFSEFMGGGDEPPFVTFGSGTATSLAPVANHPGIVRLGTSNSTTGAHGAGIDDPDDASVLFNSDEVWWGEAVLRIPTLSAGTQTFVVTFGFIDTLDSDPDDGCYFRYNNSTNGGRWQGRCTDASTSSCDTGITVAADTWYRLTVVVTGGEATFYVNGVSACTVSSNIPSTAGNETGFNATIRKTAGNTERNLDIDYMEMRVQVSR